MWPQVDQEVDLEGLEMNSGARTGWTGDKAMARTLHLDGVVDTISPRQGMDQEAE